MKSILLVGLGRFGRHMAEKFYDQHNEVTAVDLLEARVEEVLPYVKTAKIGDTTKSSFVASLGVRSFDLCVLAIGDNLQSSLETIALLRQNGAKYILARASRDVHAKFLLKNGADDVVYVEKEMAIRTAMKYGSEHVFDYIELTPEYSICEIPVPSNWVGKTIVQAAVRPRCHVSVLAVKDGGEISPLPKPDHEFQPRETLILMGATRDLRRFIQ